MSEATFTLPECAEELPEKYQRLLMALPSHDWNIPKAGEAIGYSHSYAHTYLAPRLKGNISFCQALKDLRAQRLQSLGVTTERVLEELAIVAFSDLRDFVDWGPDGVSIKSSEELGEKCRAVLEVVEHASEGQGSKGGHHRHVTRKVKLHPKIPALEKLLVHCKEVQDSEAEDRSQMGPIMIQRMVVKADADGRALPSDPDTIR